jgi:anionic cell wall polymer biosynthesis LytR-Cps2A-Psr (LCP) family protein
MRTINQAFGLNITRYAVIDFEGFSDLIDSIGGVLVNVSKAEMKEVNKGLDATWKRLGDGKPIDYLTTYGEGTLLTGPQALAYSRIRKIDSDYVRHQPAARRAGGDDRKAALDEEPGDLRKADADRVFHHRDQCQRV